MSLLSSILQKVAPIAATVGKFIPGIGTAVAAAGTAASIYYGAKSTVSPVMPSVPKPSLPGLTGGAPGLQMGMFPGIGSFAPAAGRIAGVAVAGAKRVYSAAANYCRKHPQWCSTIGGIAAVEGLINSGQLPIPKRRRGRGITATELKHFKRVARFTSKYCAPVRRAMSSPAVKRGRRI